MKELGWKFAADVAVTGIALLLAFVILIPQAIGIDYMNVKRSGIQFLEARRRYDCRFCSIMRHKFTHLSWVTKWGLPNTK
ncbi:hypothetical protein L210DRAFT_3546586 [Boletus edulis BED1]|uniref:Uncharacterized protein n=1 Tax=Boletus edulis BED1 TaxID=1328754 RepID=A0AAD4BR24_BOLED|nr:hypothetical protein L210DRAFT_3546586 [Boletus edulis BED1]